MRVNGENDKVSQNLKKSSKFPAFTRCFHRALLNNVTNNNPLLGFVGLHVLRYYSKERLKIPQK